MSKGRSNGRAAGAPPRPDAVRRRRIRADLVRRGVADEFSESICDRLAPFSEDLTPELYDAVLSGVAMAYGVHRRRLQSGQETVRNVAEVERLLSGFVDEMRKLDEALETLAAYLEGMRRRAELRPKGALH